MTTISLNAGQQAAADGFFQFLFEPDQSELIISGAGGTGKSFLMGYLIDKIITQYQSTCSLLGSKPDYEEVHMTATTNKAAEALAEYTNRPTSTIHSMLGLKVQDDFQTGRSKLIQTNNWTVHENKILFVDECSFMDTPLRNFLHSGTLNCKIVYVGDHCQLAPVMESLSPIYRDNLPFYELTEQRRSDNPDLQTLNNQLRKTVETGEFNPIRMVPGSIDYLTDDQMEEALYNHFIGGSNNDRVLAYTNERVVAYNDHFRTIRNQPDEWQEGEWVINNAAIRIDGTQISVEQELMIESQASRTIFDYIDDDVKLEIRETNIKTKFGGLLERVRVPVNRKHYLDLVRHYASRKNWKLMYHLKNNYPDLRQRDAITFHKSQGSSYDNVFIDLGNLSTCRNSDPVARMLYVAVSRARKRVFFYGQLASKYGSIIQ